MAGDQVPCPRCGAGQTTEAADAGRAVACWRCGERVSTPGPVVLARPPVAARAARASRRGDDEPPRRRPRRPRPPPVSGAAVTSLILGVLSCLMFCAWPVSLATSVAGLITGAVGRDTPSRKLAVSGIVLSATGLIFGVGFLALTVAGISLFDPKGTGTSPPPFFPVTP